MCGRFTLRTPMPELVEHFRAAAAGVKSLPPRFNVAPTQDVAAVRSGETGRELVLLHWGLIPGWAKDAAIGNRMINARGETVAEKPAFRAAFRRRRCLVAADGFYEWKKEGRAKQPYLIARPDGGPLGLAGLWERWEPEGGPRIESCTIVTTEANGVLADLHDRMPVILDPVDYGTWLGDEEATDDRQQLLDLLAPCPDAWLVTRPVSTHVNNPRHEDPRCIES